MKKKKRNYFLIVLSIFFFSYLALLFAYSNGYYEYKEHNKMVITEEAMKQFEEDVSSGKNIEINDYITDEYRDYSSTFSKLGVKTGELLDDVFSDGLGSVVKMLSKLFVDKKE